LLKRAGAGGRELTHLLSSSHASSRVPLHATAHDAAAHTARNVACMVLRALIAGGLPAPPPVPASLVLVEKRLMLEASPLVSVSCVRCDHVFRSLGAVAVLHASVDTICLRLLIRSAPSAQRCICASGRKASTPESDAVLPPRGAARRRGTNTLVALADCYHLHLAHLQRRPPPA
jgi:hypothetical protein